MASTSRLLLGLSAPSTGKACGASPLKTRSRSCMQFTDRPLAAKEIDTAANEMLHQMGGLEGVAARLNASVSEFKVLSTLILLLFRAADGLIMIQRAPRLGKPIRECHGEKNSQP